jgi:hypothetical protein
MAIEIDASHWPERSLPLTVPWPLPGNAGSIHTFDQKEAWLDFIRRFDLHTAVPRPTGSKYLRAQKLYAYAWLEFDFIKAGELVALSALEGALKDCYGKKVIEIKEDKSKEPMLAELVEYMIEQDGLNDHVFAYAQRYRDSVVDYLYEKKTDRKERMAKTKEALKASAFFIPLKPMTLAEIRNGLAHGDPMEGWPWGGLLEIVRDLIEYAYRHRIQGYASLA